MTFELSREHEEFRRSVREFAEAEIAPHAAQWDRDHHFPVDVVQQDGRARAVRPHRAGGVRRAARARTATSPACAWRSRRSAGSTSRWASRSRPAVGLGINPILTYGTDEQKQTWLPDLVAGRTARRLRPDRARRRLRRRRDPHQGRARRRRVGRQRRQAVHHQLRLRDHLLVTVTARTGDARGRQARRSRTIIVPERHAGLHRREGLRQARLARLRHPPAVVRGRPRPRGQPARRARPRLRAVPRHPRRRPGRDRRARGRLHPGLPRHEPAVRRRAADLRRPDRAQAGRGLPDRRPRGDARTPAGC